MDYLQQLGYNIYRLRDFSEKDEFLLFNIKLNTYHLYSEKRLISILKSEFKNNKIDINKTIKLFFGLSDDRVIKVDIILKEWVEEELILIDTLGYKPLSIEKPQDREKLENLNKDDKLLLKNLFLEDKLLKFNLYNKSKILTEFEPNNYIEFPYIRELILNLVGNDEDYFLYFCKWIGWQLQNPLQRLPTSIILQGEQGTGKTKFCQLVLKPIFETNFTEISQTQINSEYNDFITGKQLIVANEVIQNDNKYLVPDKLKSYTTDDFIQINQKYKSNLFIKNYSQWIFVTNNEMPLKIDKGDRRYTVFNSIKLKNGIDLINNIIDNHKEEIQGFLEYLLYLNINFMEVSIPIENEAKEIIQEISLSSVELFEKEVKLKGGIEGLYYHYIENYSYNFKFNIIENNNKKYVSIDNLYRLYLSYCENQGFKSRYNKVWFSRKLKKNKSFKSKIIKFNKLTLNCFKIGGKK